MADLSSNLFLRELAKRDMDQERRRRDEAANVQAFQQMFEQSEGAREAAFQRKLSTAKLLGEQAGRRGEKAPEFEEAAIQESGQVGFGGGSARREEELTAAERKAALEKLKAMEEMKRVGFSKAQDAARQAAMDKENAARNALTNKTRLDEQRMIQAGLDRRFRERAAIAGAKPGAHLPAETRNKLLTKQRLAEEAEATFDEIERLSLDPDTGKPDYSWLEGASQGDISLISLKSSAGRPLTPTEQARIDKSARLEQLTGYFSSERFHELLGAAQTDPEVKRVVRAIINREMSPAEFPAAMSQLRKTLRTQAEMGAARLENRPALEVADEDPARFESMAEQLREERSAIETKARLNRKFQGSYGDTMRRVLDEAVAQNLITREERTRWEALVKQELALGERIQGWLAKGATVAGPEIYDLLKKLGMAYLGGRAVGTGMRGGRAP